MRTRKAEYIVFEENGERYELLSKRDLFHNHVNGYCTELESDYHLSTCSFSGEFKSDYEQIWSRTGSGTVKGERDKNIAFALLTTPDEFYIYLSKGEQAKELLREKAGNFTTETKEFEL